MHHVEPWIAHFVGVCLSFYLEECKQEGIEVKDDGATLSFRFDGFTCEAFVAEVCNLQASRRSKTTADTGVSTSGVMAQF